MKTIFSFAIILLLLSGFQKAWPVKLTEKINKIVASTYEIETFNFKSIEVTDEIENQTSAELKNSFFEINTDDDKIGYLYINQAPSMKNVFDYAVLFDTDLKILNTKVLIYRETHGKQIGTKRWLSQFFGMNIEDRPKLGEQVDGITGATISVNSMTTAVHNLLESLDSLHKQGSI